jgi:anaerobic selenocysteine-containing dehydrogenase
LDRTVCTPAKDYGWRAVMGATLPPHPDEVMHSDLILLWGTNTLATNIHFLHGVREAQKRGAVVWLIETYQTPTADLADRTFLVRPGSDGALALGIMHILVRDGLIDQGFLRDHVQGFDEFKAAILPGYTPQHVSNITGLDVALLEELAVAYGKAKAPFIRLGSGLSRYGNGAMTVRTVTCLPALVGAWGKPGGGLMPDLSTGGALAVDEISRPDLMKKPTRAVNLAQLGYALTELATPPIKSLYVYNCNPAAVLPDQNRVLAGLAREDLFTVVHERFMTDTARYADIILPATTSLEHADIYRAYGHYGLQRAFAVTPPVGQAKSNWEVFGLLAQAMGFTEDIFHRTANEMIEHMLSVKTPWMEQVNLQELLNGNPVELPLPVDYKTTYQTPSGKIEIRNPQEDEVMPRYTPPHNEEGVFWLMTAPAVWTLNSSFNERPELLEKKAAMTLQMNPEDAAHKKLADGQHVVAFNPRGEVTFVLHVTPRVPCGVVVTEGVWWIKDAPGDRTVNALTSQRVTDRAAAATYYDTKIDVRPA